MLSIQENGDIPLWSSAVSENIGGHSGIPPLKLFHYDAPVDICLYGSRRYADNGDMPHAKVCSSKHISIWACGKNRCILKILCNKLKNGKNGDTPLWTLWDHQHFAFIAVQLYAIPFSKVHGAYMGPTWGRQDPGGPHFGPMILAIWDIMLLRTICYESRAGTAKLASPHTFTEKMGRTSKTVYNLWYQQCLGLEKLCIIWHSCTWDYGKAWNVEEVTTMKSWDRISDNLTDRLLDASDFIHHWQTIFLHSLVTSYICSKVR